MFSLHQRVRFETIAEPRATSLSPRFHKCSADNDVIIPPRFLSSRSSSFHLPLTARSCSVHVTLLHVLSVSFHPSSHPAPILRTGNFNGCAAISIESNFFRGRTTKRYFYYSYYRITGAPCVPRHLPIAVLSIIVPVPWPRDDGTTLTRRAPGWNAGFLHGVPRVLMKYDVNSRAMQQLRHLDLPL